MTTETRVVSDQPGDIVELNAAKAPKTTETS